MTTPDFSLMISVAQSPEQVFDAINNVRGWWSAAIDGPTDVPDAQFTYRYKDVHICKLKITSFIPGKKVAWQVLENYFNFTKNEAEWTGTMISFDIVRVGDKTNIRFTHHGLVPADECFEICSNAWSQYIGKSLRNLITDGLGQPNPIESIVDEAAEKAATL